MTELVQKLGDIVVEFLDYAISFFNYFIDSFKVFTNFFNVFGGNQYTDFISYTLYGFCVFLIIHFARKLFSS